MNRKRILLIIALIAACVIGIGCHPAGGGGGHNDDHSHSH